MASTKRVFTAFAIEDEKLRVMLVGQRLHTDTPFEWTDMSVKEPWSSEWKTKCRTRIKGCDGVIGIITPNTPKASGQLWELKCAYEEKRPVLLIRRSADRPLSAVPEEIRGRPVVAWSWPTIETFIKKL
ncbi:hypothetical protein [Bradyrhizobium sp. Ec3.3]|uniref:hypothetical protein n=1 Tax=Bradyrhizobium sp. Ec3.3 TaxID=189753 RepID=UPI0005576171|nr:hypothetical protein [Bradyrhizobium sp. Ec3.3]